MAGPAQLNQIIGYVGKIEADYGVAETLSNSADGLNPYIGDGDPPPPESYEAVFDGSTGRAAGVLAPQKRTTPNGFSRSGPFRMQIKGLGSTYSASAFPPNEVHRWFQACGFTATYSASPTPQWTYTPSAAGTYSGMTLRQFAQGSQYDQTGVLGNLSFETEGVGIPIATVDWKGIQAAPADQSTPAVTIEAPTIIAPVASAITLEIGSYDAAVVRRVAFRQNRNLDSARISQTVAGAHSGFVPGAMMPELEIEIERPLRSAYDPEAAHRAATSAAVFVTFGTTQYNRFTVTLPQAQITAPPVPGNEGAIATVTLTFGAHASTPTANDFLSILMN